MPVALRSSATRDRIGRPGTAKPISAVDLQLRWSLRASLSEHLRARGDALVTDVDRRDDGAGAGILHFAPGKELWYLLPRLPAERADERGKVRRGFLDLRRLFIRQEVGIGVATRLIASSSHQLPPIA